MAAECSLSAISIFVWLIFWQACKFSAIQGFLSVRTRQTEWTVLGNTLLDMVLKWWQTIPQEKEMWHVSYVVSQWWKYFLISKQLLCDHSVHTLQSWAVQHCTLCLLLLWLPYFWWWFICLWRAFNSVMNQRATYVTGWIYWWTYLKYPSTYSPSCLCQCLGHHACVFRSGSGRLGWLPSYWHGLTWLDFLPSSPARASMSSCLEEFFLRFWRWSFSPCFCWPRLQSPSTWPSQKHSFRLATFRTSYLLYMYFS